MNAALIQARMGSSRFPGKVLQDIAGRPMLWHVITRVRAATTLDRVTVVTSTAPSDDCLTEFCRREGIECFRGHEDDVLDRYYQSAQSIGADPIVRITADCPLIDPDVIDHVMHCYAQGECDYASNDIERTYPDGLDVEVCSFAAIQQAWRDAVLQSEREHVTPYIRNHPELFRIRNVRQGKDLSELRWTVDAPEDLELVRQIFGSLELKGPVFRMQDVLDLLKRRPELLEINRGHVPNEGYLRSLQADRAMAPRNQGGSA